MSQYYRAKRTKNLFNPDSEKPFTLSRSRLELFMSCPRCFYFDRRLGIDRPPGYPFTLNSAVDKLLKKEFDIHRLAKSKHPLIKSYGIDAIPFDHPNIEEWRDSLRHGIKFYHQPTNLIIRGGIDDVWINRRDELIIVDYKATSVNGIVTLEDEWKISYKRQMEIYQWLFRMNGFTVSSTGYFVYCNGSTDAQAFDAKLEFDVRLIPYDGDDSWVENIVFEAHKCLMGEELPAAAGNCDYCDYIREIRKASVKKLINKAKKIHKKEPVSLFEKK